MATSTVQRSSCDGGGGNLGQQQQSCCKPKDKNNNNINHIGIRDQVQEMYGTAVKSIGCGKPSGCGSKSAVLNGAGVDAITRDLYSSAEQSQVPTDAVLASFGCGNPTALAQLRDGEVVLDLGSGGGIDVLLSARRVAPSGKAYGLDMTPEMLQLARRNQEAAGVTNVEFLQGHIEAIPLEDGAVDVIISNCVINLSSDKGLVLREAHRVLRSGGRLAVSDIVLRRELPESLRSSIELWAGCIAGALQESEYREKLSAAGFVDISFEPTRVYTREDAEELGASLKDLPDAIDALDGAAMSAFIRARKL